MHGLRRLSAAVLLLAAGGCSAALPAAEDKDARAAWKAVQVQLRSRTAAERVEALRKLRTFPPAEAAGLTVQYGLGDRAAEVRQTAFDTLLTWSQNAEVCRLLLTTLDKEVRRKADARILVPLIGVLLDCDLPEIEGEALRSVDSFTSTGPGQSAALALADELARQADRLALKSLRKMARLRCFADSFPCRRAVVQGMIRVPGAEAIDALLDLLPKLDGEVRGDVVRHLTQTTGQAHGGDGDAWLRWWKEHRAEFDRPAAGTIRLKEMVVQGAASYYGLPLYARRIVFVIDISGSMKGQRLETAKRELVRAVEGLPDDVRFNIVVFGQRAFPWQKNLIRADAAGKKSAVQFARGLLAKGDTATYDALEAAMRFDAEAVYLLTDGRPTTGKIVAAEQIVAAVARENAARRISVYTIGIDPGEPGGEFDEFLKNLAESNSGLYRRVE